MTLVMGMDQHRAQISAEWIDTITGEISRARVTPADRAGVRKFLARFQGEGLEVALEATTGWRFLVVVAIRCSLGASSSATVTKPARTRSALELRRSLHVGADGLLVTPFGDEHALRRSGGRPLPRSATDPGGPPAVPPASRSGGRSRNSLRPRSERG